MDKRVGVVAVVVALAAGLWFWLGNDADKKSTGELGAAPPRSSVLLAPRTQAATDVRKLPKVGFSGRITEVGGKAIASARVCANAWSRGLSNFETRRPTCTLSSGDGSYKFEGLVPAWYSVSASAKGFLGKGWEDPEEDDEQSFRLEASETRSGVDIELKRGGVLVRGAVKDIGGGVVAGALVSSRGGGWFDRSREGAMSALSDEKGEFELWVKEGDLTVSAQADGYASGESEAIAPGQYIEVLLTPESVLAGKVVEVGTGKPVARARVSTSQWGGTSVFTDKNGEFRISGLDPERYKPFAAAMGMYGQAAESVMLGVGQTVDGVLIEVHPAYVVTATILKPDGEACKRGSAYLRNNDLDRYVQGQSENADGTLIFEAVLPGSYDVTVTCPDHLALEEYPKLEVEDSDITGLEWKVEAGAKITGVVLGPNGEKIEGVGVSASMVGGMGMMSGRGRGNDASDSDGKFEFVGIAPGEYKIELRSSDYPAPDEPTKVVTSPEEPARVEIQIPASGSIVGTVKDENGNPVAGAQIRASGKRWGSSPRSKAKDDGTFSLDAVKPGDYRVTAASPNSWWGQTLRTPGKNDDDQQGQRVSVKVGSSTSVALVVESQGGEISGTVFNGEGQPVGDAFVTASRESDAAGANRLVGKSRSRWSAARKPVLTDTDGGFTARGLSKGSYTVRAYRRGGGEAFAEGVQVGSRIELRIMSTGEISGIVKNGDGSIPDEFEISVADPSKGFSRSERFFRTGGKWRLSGLPAGTYEASAGAVSGDATQKGIALKEGGKRSGINFSLEALVDVSGRLVGLESGEPIKGMKVFAQGVGATGRSTFSFDPNDKDSISDGNGRFKLTRVKSGRVYLSAWSMDWEDSEYGWARKLVVLEPERDNDVGEIAIPKRRVKGRTRSGDLGFTTKEQDPEIEPEDYKIEIALVRPDGPAADSGLEVGDVVVSIDGHDVRGANHYLYWSFARVPPGDTIKLGLARGDEVSITAAATRL